MLGGPVSLILQHYTCPNDLKTSSLPVHKRLQREDQDTAGTSTCLPEMEQKETCFFVPSQQKKVTTL